MRILFLTHLFNSLAQRLYVELAARGHELSVEFDINEAVTEEAVALFRPDLIVAPLLKRAIPPSVWHRHVCLIVHPGPPGDRGPSALDWAIGESTAQWGVTVLQADAELDAGPVWASSRFPMREAAKSSLYRFEVTQAAVAAVCEAVERFEKIRTHLSPNRARASRWRPLVRAAERCIDWKCDETATVLRKIRAADGFPGVPDDVLGLRCRLYDAHPEGRLRGAPGAVIARRDGAICRATCDGAVWFGCLKPEADGAPAFKLPATQALGARAEALPESAPPADESPTYREIRYAERGPVGFLSFDFYNGALSAAQCERLRAAYADACRRPTRVIVLLGGTDFWCNGMHLHVIEAADSPADESWRNINAIDDLVADILRTDTHLTIAALFGNAGAGGVFLALAADRVYARDGVVLNPHYKNMGNLYGSEYWTYLLPRRVGTEGALAILRERLPVGASQATRIGLIDGVAGPSPARFRAFIDETAAQLAGDNRFTRLLAGKCARRARDEFQKPLEAYHAEELERMRLNFYGFDPSYHVARHRFVHRTPQAWTPLYLARHRRLDFARKSGNA